MPATEQTWRNQKVMHIIFAASALVMVIATLWLMAKDHNREWKDWQLANRKKEAWMTQASRDKTAALFASQLDGQESELRRLQSEPIDPSYLVRFKEIVTAEESRLARDESQPFILGAAASETAISEVSSSGSTSLEATSREAASDFTKLEAAFAAFNELAQAAQSARAQVVAEAAKAQASKVGEEGPGPEVADDAGQQPDLAPPAALTSSQEEALEARRELLVQFADLIRQAKFREKQLVGRRKFVSADRTATVSEKGLKIGEDASKDVLETLQEKIQGYTDEISDLTGRIASAKTYRTDLEGVVGEINAAQDAISKQSQALLAELSRLDDLAYKNTSNVFEWVTRWPVLNALYDGNMRIDQIWLPDMTINYNFSQVARFDRCKSCHQSISQTAAGTTSGPAYPTLPREERELGIELQTPDAAPADGASLRDVYGLVLEAGVMDYSEVTVHYVLPQSLAAQAGLESGDVVRLAGDQPVYEPETVDVYLLNRSKWGESAMLSIRRGFDHPFTSHPRLDLYMTDTSPHPEKDFGCTICHDGQGSGTEFPWTSHTPNSAEQQIKWTRDHNWFDNHHWIFPMKPARFVESNCLKCHHEKGALEPSERFPEPPAEKLVQGWTLVEKYGCFGCHEIGGFDGPDKRIGPDVRLESNYADVAQQILRDEGLSDEQRDWTESLVRTPEDDRLRHQLAAVLNQDAKLAQQAEIAASATLTPQTHRLAAGLKDVEAPGTYRKVGPSLRFLRSKVEFNWLYSWIEKPANFRPSTRMPQFFGLHEHLQDEDDETELATAERFEPVEIRALSEFLLANSSDFEYLAPPAEVTEKPSAERGKWLFESRGCLACHSHESFPGIASEQGPDLSRVSAKFKSNKGALWLYSWVKEPHRYHVRTKMPVLFLDPIAEKDASGMPTGAVTDPAADIAAFLLAGKPDWTPQEHATTWSANEEAALKDLAQEWLTSDDIPSARAQNFVHGDGIPAHLEPKLKADEKLLIGLNNGNRTDRLRDYVARRTISKYGCFGCHDIPGFEEAKPIGTALAEWGRKESSKLAFENMHKFLEGAGNPNHDEEHVAHGHLDPADFDPDTSYFIQSLNSHARDGFIWQKLRMPRSYDYKTTKNKGYNERLRMPKFPFSAAEREAVITFVLGLVNEAPADKYVYKADPRQEAIVAGRKVLEQFNCAGCHTLEMEQWQIAFEAGQFEEPSEVADYPFLAKSFSDKEIALSEFKDSRGLLQATLHGQPMMNEETGLPERVDEDGLPIEPDDDESEPYYLLKLWKDGLVEGVPWLVGIQDLMVPAAADGYGPAIGTAYPAWGGDLTRYLFPRVIAHVHQSNPEAKGSEAWGWLPPPLMSEGKKVQTDWLHAFLMDPTAIRPAAVMRMPNFHMSTREAAKLVNYFAAASDTEFPYEYKSRQRESYLAEKESDYPERMQGAMNIVVNGNYCVKCHTVEDFEPKGDATTFGPNLADVHRRLRPEFLRNWVANPKRILPYTGMPVNIPYKPGEPGVAETLFHGTSVEQLDGLVDLLMNFDTYARRQTEITPLVKESAAKNAPTTSDAANNKPSRR